MFLSDESEIIWLVIMVYTKTVDHTKYPDALILPFVFHYGSLAMCFHYIFPSLQSRAFVRKLEHLLPLSHD